MTADTRFALPAVDSSPLAETGVVLLGLDAPRLLAGLAVAESADDPALVALAVDEARHGVTGRAAFGGLVAAGAVRWRTARGTLAAAGAPVPASASLRQAFARALDVLANVLANVLPDAGLPDGAGRAYLAACWLRRDEVDRCAAGPAPGEEPSDVVPAVTAGPGDPAAGLPGLPAPGAPAAGVPRAGHARPVAVHRRRA